MIIILSGDGDLSTDFVVEYLTALNYRFIRINSYDLLNDRLCISSKNGSTELVLADQVINLDEIGAVWYRKFGFFYKSEQYKHLVSTFNVDIANNISKEFTSVLETVVQILYKKNWLTHPSTIGINKFDVIRQAQKLEIDTPDSYLINSRESLQELLLSEECITKSIRDPWIIRNGMKSIKRPYSMFTSILDKDEVHQISSRFFPSFVQKKIDKDFEIRTFYLMGKFYSMAIFSQLDAQTSIDFRKYNWQKPNRRAPFTLPSNLEVKLKKLMQHYGFNCCSIDIIKGKDGKYYLLEINPTGQFGMVDFPCNYGLHMKVAQSLIYLDKKYHEKKEKTIGIIG
ncbi:MULTISPECIES: grasp-with-spasm system ATP-grasp peptide maturase [Sphingobacterium]|uniref:grasp-with-spasm system ATP-grasp peptide maturase n=1 Tax=Sphingobacterium TaxID=28453 RepID=UPI0024A6300B|nr:grasp-with-spasm system ATP-grasp peptide maturase [Sphingobacterium thalpophilum]